jgi:hypothetical protein
MRLFMLLAMAGFFLFATPAQATCDQYDRAGWACFTPKKTYSHRAKRNKYPGAMRLGYARGVNTKLRSAFRYVQKRCRGTRAVSGRRRTYVSGTRRRSLHWNGNALDFRTKSYRCAYSALRKYGWKHGMSRDGVRCRHIHISYGGRRREPRGFRHRRC